MKTHETVASPIVHPTGRGGPESGLPPARPRLKVAVCSTHPIQYQAPLWRQLARRPELDVKVIFGTDMSVRGYRDKDFGVALKWDTPLLEGYDAEFLSMDPRIEHIDFRHPGFGGGRSRLAAFAPDVVVLTAYRGLFHLGALAAARSLGAQVVLRHEASDVAEARSPLKGMIRDWTLRQLYARVDRFAAIGTEARRHLRRLGVMDAKIGFSPYCVDSEFMERQTEIWRPQRERLRAELGARPDDVVLVFAGKLIPKKFPLLIVQALTLLPPESVARIHLVVAGEGELRSRLEEAGRAVLGPRLHLLGFLNQSGIGRAYAAGDCLVLPSLKGAGETWGLVVNEALQFGLHALVSDGVGCHPDLVSEGETGFVFPSGDAAALAAALRRYLALGEAERTAFSAAARRRAADYSLEAAAGGLAETISLTVRR